MQQQLTSMLEQLNAMTSDTTSKLQKNLVTSSQHMGQEMQDVFRNTINKIIDSNSSMAEKLQQTLENFEKLLAASTANIEENNRIQASYKDTTARQQDVVEKFSAIAQTIESTVAGISDASRENKSVANAFQESADQINALTQRMDSMWQAYDQKFKDTDETMSKNFTHFERCTRQFQTQIEKYVHELTREFEKAITILGEQLEDLSDAIGDKNKHDRSA